MVLRDRNLLALDDTLARYVPDAAYPDVTVEQLMRHTSGLPDWSGWLSDYAAARGGIPGSSAAVTEFLRAGARPRQFAPGTRWAYCNVGYTALAMIVERVAGRPFPDFLREALFLPAGMTHTALLHIDRDGGRPAHLATGMVLEHGRYVAVGESQSEGYTTLLDGGEGDGGVKTSVDDLLLWDRALRRGEILSLATQREMYAPTRLPDGTTYPYGFGWELGHAPQVGAWVSHSGRWAGYNTMYVRLLEQDGVAVALCNQMGCDTQARIETLDGVKTLTVTGRAPLPETLDAQADPAALKAAPPTPGVYHITDAPITALFADTASLYYLGETPMLRLIFMDTVFDSEMVPVGPSHFITRDGLFDVRMAGDDLITGQFGADFRFTRRS
jgi:CubicO group peptidase (beta-lactamase class C family)